MGGSPRASGWARTAALAVALIGASPPSAFAKTLQIVAFGDSLTAGYMLPAPAAFPVVLEKALRQNGFDVSVANAGVSGDTTSGGLDRLDWSVSDGTDGVILELGANDMLRGQDPALTDRNLATIIHRLQDRHIKVFLAGMRATPTLGADYVQKFDAIFPALARTYGLPLYPFFLEGVAGHAASQLADGMHPNAGGVDTIVRSMLPAIETWLRTMPAQG